MGSNNAVSYNAHYVKLMIMCSIRRAFSDFLPIVDLDITHPRIIPATIQIAKNKGNEPKP